MSEPYDKSVHLKPCPFCGGEAERAIGKLCRYPWDLDIEIRCTSCGTTIKRKTWIEAVAAWNCRADARQTALQTGICPMCEDCPDGCPIETPEDSKNKGAQKWIRRQNVTNLEAVQRDCPLCDSVHTVEKRVRIGSMLIKGEPVQFEETYFFCPNCADDDENEFVPAELMDKNLQNARNSYCKRCENIQKRMETVKQDENN